MKVKIDDGAFMPSYAHGDDAGMDLRSPVTTIVRAHDSETIDSGVHMAIPHGMVGMLKSKSGLNTRHGIVSEGVIDCGYTGSIRVKLYNHSNVDFHVIRGDKITQICIMPVAHPTLEVVNALDETERGVNGFGSSGR